MKFKFVFILAFIMALSVSLSAQKIYDNINYVELKSGLKISDKYSLDEYFKVSKNKLYASKGYKIAYSSKKNVIVIVGEMIKVTDDIIDDIMKQDGTINLSNATITCYGCGGGTGGCNPSVQQTTGNYAGIVCSSGCESCQMGVSIHEKVASNIQTSTGENIGL